MRVNSKFLKQTEYPFFKKRIFKNALSISLILLIFSVIFIQINVTKTEENYNSLTNLIKFQQTINPPEIQWNKTYGGANWDEGRSIIQTNDGGYIVAGGTSSFGNGGFDVYILKLDSNGNIQWNKTYGGIEGDIAYSIQQTKDGGYIVVGGTTSFGAGLPDLYILKLDSNGNLQWQKTYGWGGWDEAFSVQQTPDGGYIVVGFIGDNVYILKLDSNGNLQWEKTYGGSNDEKAYSIQQTKDGGYIVAGYTESFGNGKSDVYILKLYNNGNLEWYRTYGGSNDDVAYSIQQTNDGGYIVAGYTTSFGNGGADVYILKLDRDGNLQWYKTYGGRYNDIAYSIQQTKDGGFIIAGETWSFGNGLSDFYILKLDNNGNLLWQITYGGEYWDEAFSVQQTNDGGYIIVGETLSFGSGDYDVYIIKLAPETTTTIFQTTTPPLTQTQPNLTSIPPETQWYKIYGGSNDDKAYSIQQTKDGGYIVAGYTTSFGNGGADVYILKLDRDGNILWSKTYGGSNDDGARSIIQTSDGGYIVAGVTASFGNGQDDAYILKLDSNGNLLWYKVYGGSYNDTAISIQQTIDGGYILAGYTESFGNGKRDVYILKLDNNGNLQWYKTYGGSNDDVAFSIQQTKDGGYIVAGVTSSFGSEGFDFYILKLDNNGNLLWQKTYGGSYYDIAYSIQQTNDGGYIVAGITTPSMIDLDVYILKLDSNGNLLWYKTYGGRYNDIAISIQQTNDGGYIIAGITSSFGNGQDDAYIIKLDNNGNLLWYKTYGGGDDDGAYSIQQTNDGGYIIAGYTESYAGNSDVYIIKLAPETTTSPITTTFPTTTTFTETTTITYETTTSPITTTITTSPETTSPKTTTSPVTTTVTTFPETTTPITTQPPQFDLLTILLIIIILIAIVASLLFLRFRRGRVVAVGPGKKDNP